MNVRHDVAKVQDDQSRRKRLAFITPSGQQLITDWLGQKWKRTATTDEAITGIREGEYGEDKGHEIPGIYRHLCRR